MDDETEIYFGQKDMCNVATLKFSSPLLKTRRTKILVPPVENPAN
jgi:hypothetical protein